MLSTGVLAAQELPPLKVSESRRFLETTRVPFFWLGDTAWELIHRLDSSEMKIYLDDRKQKGFNIIQTVILAELDGLNTPNAYGDLPLHDNDPTRINEDYFKLVDFVIEESAKRSIYIALLPTWGDKFNKAWGIGPEIFQEDNAFAFGEILGFRYRNYSNIIWVMGGDRWPADEEDERIISSMAKGIRNNAKNQLMTYHPSGGKVASEWFCEADWLDFDMFQTTHKRSVNPFEFINQSRKCTVDRPVINGEPPYENIPNNLDLDNSIWLDDSDVRKMAYYSILSGAAGYTYGSHDIWQMYEAGRNPEIGARLDWRASMQLPGARHMTFFKQFFETYDWTNLNPCQHIILNNNPMDEDFVSIAINEKENLIVAYSPAGRNIEINRDDIPFRNYQALWFNPRDGHYYKTTEKYISNILNFNPPSKGIGSDYLLVLTKK